MWFERMPERPEAWQYTGDINLLPDELMPAIRLTGGPCVLNSLQGLIECAVGDWIVRGAKGEIYICPDGTFRRSYRSASDSGSVLFLRRIPRRSPMVAGGPPFPELAKARISAQLCDRLPDRPGSWLRTTKDGAQEFYSVKDQNGRLYAVTGFLLQVAVPVTGLRGYWVLLD